jgi:hydroxymethylbilane synthase
MTDNSLILGTRGSPLALWQTEQVKQALLKVLPNLTVHVQIIQTQGDKILDRPLAAIGDKGLFTKELEQALYAKTIDVAVHSLKDLPSTLPEGLAISAILQRHQPFDALVSQDHLTFDALPQGALVGTGSLRRKTQLQQLRPDLDFADLRGNIQTRLAKLDRGDYAAIIMAQAALERMELGERISEVFSAETMLPAVGQGAIALESRLTDTALTERLQHIAHPETTACVTAERAYLKALGGGCEKPIAGYALIREGRLWLRGRIASVDGSQILEDALEIPFPDLDLSASEAMGSTLGERMLLMGGRELLDA